MSFAVHDDGAELEQRCVRMLEERKGQLIVACPRFGEVGCGRRVALGLGCGVVLAVLCCCGVVLWRFSFPFFGACLVSARVGLAGAGVLGLDSLWNCPSLAFLSLTEAATLHVQGLEL